ncbi:hypothetical protein [Cobetia sp. L2A1]|uniref:hypothetical protein n=1 Tax=Cobetia sp. L2A1 TaxID=2686360 RepID=UPI00131B048C|nr:hypothetical protein [Cobetia sp. L2A1]
MATTPMTTLLETCRAMTAKVTTQKFTLLSRTAVTKVADQTESHQLLDVMAMGYIAPSSSLQTSSSSEISPHDTRSSGDIASSLIAKQQAVFNPEVIHTVQADWEILHRHQALARRGMLA